MKNQHTPGQWDVIRLNVGDDRTQDKFAIRQNPLDALRDPNTRKDLNIATVNAEDGEANAALIASAPQLLAQRDELRGALQRLLRANQADYEQCPTMDVKTAFETNSQAISQARATLARTEGDK